MKTAFVVRFLLFSAIISTAFTGLSGCAPRRPPQPVVSAPAELPSAQQLLDTLDARRRALTSLRGLAQVAYADPHDKGKAKQAVAVVAPDRFRLELFSLLGTASLITCDGRTLAAYFPKDKVIYRGAATPLNTARFIRVSLSAREIAGLLLGLPILPLNGTAGSVSFDKETGWYRLDLLLPEGNTQTLWFDLKTTLLMRWEALAKNGTVIASMNLSDYRVVGGLHFPFEIVLSDTQGQQRASISYEQVELNPALPDSSFTFTPAAGVKEIDADTLATE